MFKRLHNLSIHESLSDNSDIRMLFNSNNNISYDDLNKLFNDGTNKTIKSRSYEDYQMTLPDGTFTHYKFDFNGSKNESELINLNGHKNINTWFLEKINKYDPSLVYQDENEIKLIRREKGRKHSTVPYPIPMENIIVEAHNLMIKAKYDIP